MVKVHTLRDYSPLDRSQQPSQSPPPLFTFGNRNSDGSITPVSCFQAFFPEFRVKSFVLWVSILQIVIFLVTEIVAMRSQNPDAFSCVLFQFGSKFTPSILISHEIQRLFMPMLLHIGPLHIFMNLLNQLIYGFRLEKTYSVKRFVALYLLAGLGGNLLSAIYLPQVQSIGASTSVYGILALQFAYLLDNFNNLGPQRRLFVIIWIVSIVATINMSVYATPQYISNDPIDNYGHIGGFVVGALLAVLFTKRDSNIKQVTMSTGSDFDSFRKLQKLALVGLIGYFVITSVVLATLDKSTMWGDLNGMMYYCNDTI